MSTVHKYVRKKNGFNSETFLKSVEPAVSVTVSLSCNSDLSMLCHGKRKGCVSYFDRKNVEHMSDSEFFTAFVRFLKCLSSQEHTVAIIYYTYMGHHSDLGRFRVRKGISAYDFLDCRQRETNEVCIMTWNCTNCQVSLISSSVLIYQAAIFSAPFWWIGGSASKGTVSSQIRGRDIKYHLHRT